MNEIDYRLYGVTVPHPKYYYQGYTIGVFVKVYKTKWAITHKLRYPNIGRVRNYISFYACLFKNNETVTLYWNGRDIIDQVTYETKIANLSKLWQKNRRRTRDGNKPIENKPVESKHDAVTPCERPANIKLCERVMIYKTKAKVRVPKPCEVYERLCNTEDDRIIVLYWTGKRFISNKFYHAIMRRKAEIKKHLTADATIAHVERFLKETTAIAVKMGLHNELSAGT
jgi:hypothetical protein